jgi:hypothetical protein
MLIMARNACGVLDTRFADRWRPDLLAEIDDRHASRIVGRLGNLLFRHRAFINEAKG